MLLVIAKILCLLILIKNGSSEAIDIDGRVVNGVEATDFIPYQCSVRVAIRDYARFGRGHTCGCVLISRRTVTTAAHCLFDGTIQRNAFDLRVVLGSLNRHIQTLQTVIRTAERIIVHPDYSRDSFPHDIGLIILRSHVEFTDIVHSILIIDHQVEDYANCQVSGWGATSWQGSMPSELRKANVSIVPRQICNSTESYGRTIVDGMVCANGLTADGLVIDVCQGDSGGPLACDNQLVGLASFGVQCGFSSELPGVFTDVFYYRDWIEENSGSGRKFSKSMSVLLTTTIFLELKRFFRS